MKSWIVAGALASSLWANTAPGTIAETFQQYTAQLTAWEQQIVDGLVYGWNLLWNRVGVRTSGADPAGARGMGGTAGATLDSGVPRDTGASAAASNATNWRRYVHRLPQVGGVHTAQTESGVRVSSGDRGVSAGAVRDAANIIDRVSAPLLKRDAGQAPKDADVVLFSTRATYQKALLKAGLTADEAADVADETGGITIGTAVWIPLYNLQDAADLTNVLTHELTHVVYVERGIGDRLPTWLDEGAAWREGLAAEASVQPEAVRRKAAAYNEELDAAAANGAVLPLTADERDILGAGYNVEWQDYLAVQQLLDRFGEDRFRAFLDGVAKYGAEGSFEAVYGMSMPAYEEEFQSHLHG
ncbi:hypothetical protein [Alicyclobacillus sp.]|uniref:hypothetical protein n=1 Tax=Alicyclobacillus sp. TaxID=61169 RepID=UPI0025B8E90E|nr:hypothetical protein [Alicyclobacillus sp.]MCL6517591.1 hypothetical protein [Alicyclobacillus sp.]